jgi:peptidyl-dipeptidase Dcp
VAWDFVELPSQLFEKWAMVPEVLDVYARHYQTNERIPEALIQKVKDSEKFGNALFGLSVIFKSQLDIDWHSVPVNGRSVEQFEADVRKNFTILPVNGALTSTSFNHIFPNSYSAGYYSYRWADVSVSDAHELFEEKGMFDPETTYLYHSQIMEKGGSEDADVIYPRFRSRAPDADAFLRHEGLIPPRPKAPRQLELF